MMVRIRVRLRIGGIRVRRRCMVDLNENKQIDYNQAV